jgi:hypothetical protein
VIVQLTRSRFENGRDLSVSRCCIHDGQTIYVNESVEMNTYHQRACYRNLWIAAVDRKNTGWCLEDVRRLVSYDERV